MPDEISPQGRSRMADPEARQVEEALRHSARSRRGPKSAHSTSVSEGAVRGMVAITKVLGFVAVLVAVGLLTWYLLGIYFHG